MRKIKKHFKALELDQAAHTSHYTHPIFLRWTETQVQVCFYFLKYKQHFYLSNMALIVRKDSEKAQTCQTNAVQSHSFYMNLSHSV